MAGPPYAQAITGPKNDLQAPLLDWSSGQIVSVGSSSAASGVINSSWDTVVELSSTTNCWYTVGSSPTAAAATAKNQYLLAGSLRYVYVQSGLSIAVIQDSASGSLAILPVKILS